LLSEVELVCDRVAILVQGKVVMQGMLDELTAESRRYEITVEGPAPAWAEGDEAIRVEAVSGQQTRLTLRGAEPHPVQPILDRLRADGRVICAMKPVRETLEDLFMRALGDSDERSDTSEHGHARC